MTRSRLTKKEYEQHFNNKGCDYHTKLPYRHVDTAFQQHQTECPRLREGRLAITLTRQRGF